MTSQSFYPHWVEMDVPIDFQGGAFGIVQERFESSLE
jgi:hypothetical protein